MKSARWWIAAVVIAIGFAPGSVAARALSVKVWTDRGQDGVYQPGAVLEIGARTSEDSYLLIYEIDAEGYVHVLFPTGRAGGFVEGGRTHRLPGPDSNLELVVQGPVGQGYVVAIASLDPFRPLPWFLRPYDAQAEEIGYHGRAEDEEEGVTAEGRIVGDPFVAMERIRRRVLEDPDDDESFATAYTSYYVHHEVRYPRYLCYDCHRPGRWAWWDGFDPYYVGCRVFDFRVNWGWTWGPPYWYGFVPHYVYVYRADCPPRYRRFHASGLWHSSWQRWQDRCNVWGSPLRRYKSPPPPGYIPPSKFDRPRRGREAKPLPPGFLNVGSGRGRYEPQRIRPLGRVAHLRGRDQEVRGVGRHPSNMPPAISDLRDRGRIREEPVQRVIERPIRDARRRDPAPEPVHQIERPARVPQRQAPAPEPVRVQAPPRDVAPAPRSPKAREADPPRFREGGARPSTGAREVRRSSPPRPERRGDQASRRERKREG